ncbi:MAG: hypothetical protein KC776_34455 [Myxococcales bacterium]|nr:hypothetical protein [Myxococcales bacterium]MCB9581009.1 hypothetical protein [Polyangiaceae bacterium]
MADPRTAEDLDAIADQLLGDLEQLDKLTSRVKAAIIAAANRARRLAQEAKEASRG